MNALSIDCLGIAAEKFPVLERDAALEQRVLADILHPTFKRLRLPLQAPPPPRQYVETQSRRLGASPARAAETGLESCGEADENDDDDEDENGRG